MVAQRGYGVSVLRDSQNSTGLGRAQPALADRTLSRGPEDLLRSLPASVALGFSDGGEASESPQAWRSLSLSLIINKPARALFCAARLRLKV